MPSGKAQIPAPFANAAVVFHVAGGFDMDSPQPPLTMVTIGWVLAKTDDVVILTSQRTEESAEHFTTIPTRSITRMIHLREAAEEDDDPPFTGLGIVPDPDDPIWQS